MNDNDSAALDTTPNFTPSAYQQAVYADFEADSGATVIEAVAGSGKSTTVLEGVKYAPRGVRAVFLAFNKSIATELQSRVVRPHDARTFHSLGLLACRRAFGEVSIDEGKTKNLAAEVCLDRGWKITTRGEDRARWAGPLAGLAGLAKNTLSHTHDEVLRLGLEYDSFPDGASPEQFSAAAVEVLDRCAAQKTRIDFDDMVWFPARHGLRPQSHDLVVADEAQDLNAAQLYLANATVRRDGRIVAVGDRHQCHPAGTMIEITGGMRIPIERVKVGEQVVSYHDCFRGVASQGRRVLAIASRDYDGEIIRISAGGESVDVTTSHRIPMRLRLDRDTWSVYVTERGETSRIGCCRTNYRRGFGPAMRARQERGERLWVLACFDDKESAQIFETICSLEYGIPEGIFFEKGRIKDRLLEAIGSNRDRLVRLLAANGREYAYPLWRSDETHQKHIGRYLYVTEACNLLDGLNEVRTFDGTRDGGEWAPVRLSRRRDKLTVYSLKVEPSEGGHRFYVADRILVHNSIYAFRGAASGAMERIVGELKARTLPLSISYRCPKSVQRLAIEVVPQFEVPSTAIEGSVVSGLEESTLYRDAKPGDLVVSRTKAPLLAGALAMIARGIPAAVAGKDLGKKLAAYIDRFAKSGDDVDSMLAFAQTHFTREIEKFQRLEMPEKAEEQSDTFQAILALSNGMTSVTEVARKIEALFVDGDPRARVLFSTTHKAKGLERDVVWMYGETYRMWDGVDEQERNLYYVAVTRAKRDLRIVGEVRR